MRSPTASARRFAEQHALWRPDEPVAVALSGGADSVGLLFVLRRLEVAGACRVRALLHLNHHVRDHECDRDEAFCRALAHRLNLPIEVGSVDVPALGAARRWSIEVAGRHARHEFLEAARRHVGAAVVAVAHTADDQAETVLLRLLRGAGPAGLRGMLPRRGHLVRPLLDVRREDLRAWLASIGETWCEDSTNRDLANPRNRIRHALLPVLARDFARGVVGALGRTADLAREDEQWLETLADEAAPGVLCARDGAVQIDCTALARAPLALQRRLVRRALHAAGHPRAYGARAVARALAACLAAAAPATDAVSAPSAGPEAQPAGAPAPVRSRGRSTPQALDLPGLRLTCRGGEAVLARAPQQSAAVPRGGHAHGTGWAATGDHTAAWGPLALRVPGAVDLPHGAGRLTAQGPVPRASAPAPGPHCAVVDAAAGTALHVRSRRPGDRLRPRGMGGHSRKLQDVLVDRKVPRERRDLVPIVVDQLDRIVWVAGHAASVDAGAPESETPVVILTIGSSSDE